MTDTVDPATTLRPETPMEAAAAMMRALQYLEREARHAGLDDLAATISGAVEAAAAAAVGGLIRQ